MADIDHYFKKLHFIEGFYKNLFDICIMLSQCIPPYNPNLRADINRHLA